MTAPVSVFNGLVQPVARAVMGDAVGAGLSGFDALLALLGQALGETADGQALATSDETARDDGTSDPSAGDPSLAAWLMRGPDNAVVAQALGLTGEDAETPGSTQAGAGPETCSLPVKPDGELPTDNPLAGDQSLPWGRGPRPPAANAAQGDPAAALARLRETTAAANNAEVPVELPETLPEAPKVTAAEAAAAATTDSAEAPETVREAAAPPPPADPRPSASRKPGSAASAAAELKSERQDAKADAAATDTVQAVESADASAESTVADAPRPEPEVLPAATRQAERPEAVTQALLSRLESVSANAAALAAQVRGAPETVAKLAAGILDKLDGQSTRFDLQLDPHGLGKVDVAVEIGADGRLTAQLGFDNAQGMAELRGRAQELRQALEQAGFSLTDNSLSFDFSGQRQRQDAQSDTSSQSAGQAFARALGLADAEADAAPVRYQARRGLDLLV